MTGCRPAGSGCAGISWRGESPGNRARLQSRARAGQRRGDTLSDAALQRHPQVPVRPPYGEEVGGLPGPDPTFETSVLFGPRFCARTTSTMGLIRNRPLADGGPCFSLYEFACDQSPQPQYPARNDTGYYRTFDLFFKVARGEPQCADDVSHVHCEVARESENPIITTKLALISTKLVLRLKDSTDSSQATIRKDVKIETVLVMFEGCREGVIY